MSYRPENNMCLVKESVNITEWCIQYFIYVIFSTVGFSVILLIYWHLNRSSEAQGKAEDKYFAAHVTRRLLSIFLYLNKSLDFNIYNNFLLIIFIIIFIITYVKIG